MNRRRFYFLFLVLLTVSLRESIAQVVNYKGTFLSPPARVPSSNTPGGPIAGNGDVGFVYAGTPNNQCFYFSKNDCWQARPGYPEGGVRMPDELRIKIKELKGASYYADEVLKNGTIHAIFKKGTLVYKMKAWVQATENLVIIEITSVGGSCSVHLDLQPVVGNGSSIDTGRNNSIYWSIRHFDTPDLKWPTHIAVAMKVLGQTGLDFKLKPLSKIQVVLSFATNHEAKDYLGLAVDRLKAISSNGIKRLFATHEKWWHTFWSKSSIDIGDSVLEKYYYGSLYLLASCSRNSSFPPGLWGNSLTEDVTDWEGDYHTNYNYEAAWWGVYSSNHIALANGYDTPILEYMRQGEHNARSLLHCHGVYYPVGIGPLGFCSSIYPLTEKKMMKYFHVADTGIEGKEMFCGQKSDALYLTANMFMRFYSTYDKKYAQKIYPFLKQVAAFWDDYLKFEKGRYVDYDDNFWEVGPWNGKHWKKNYGDVNPTLTLGLLRMFYKGMLDVSSFLGKDRDKLKMWNYTLHHLSPIPTVNIKGEIRIKACEGGNGSGSRILPGMGRVMMQALVWPSGISGVETTPTFAAILRKEISRWGKEPMDDGNWDNLSNGFETYFTAAARLGYNPQIILDTLKSRIKKTALPNLWITQSGGGIETLSAVPSCIDEMLLQGYEGIIRVFPDWPASQNANFKDLRTYGAFLVSAKIMGGDVKYVKIVSERGRKCIIENPWKGKAVIVKSSLQPTKIVSGKRLVIDTNVNEMLIIVRAK